MRHFAHILVIAVTVLSIACSKTPGYVISESEMVDLMTDMHKAEAYVEQNSQDFNSDSLRRTAKQSVLAKHGFTSEDFDTSLVWYAHHVELYVDVYERVLTKLEEEQRQLDAATGNATASESSRGRAHGRRRGYNSYGDTADIWTKARQLMLTPNFGHSTIPFDYPSNTETREGDRYALRFKSLCHGADVKVILMVDYTDASTSITTSRANRDGWNEITVQGDSTRKIRRCYGLIDMHTRPGEVAFIDSVMLLRTHLSAGSYGSFNNQKLLDNEKLNNKKEE